MRKTLCAFLVLLLLSGCTALPQPTAAQTLPTDTAAPEPAPTPETEPEPPKTGLYELISYSAEGGYRPLSLSARGNEAAVLLCPTPATDEFSASTVPHEFMHLIERRIFAWYESVGESFWDAWDALNPEGFDYYDGEDKWELVGDWFVSSYAMTDSMEDRAETFMEVFTAQTPLEECFWYQEGSHVPAKVAFLREAIRRSYPSVQAVEQAYWESK